MSYRALAAAFALTAGAGIVSSAQAADNALLGGVDANGDGMISRQEALDAQKHAFRAMDANGDGSLSGAEFEADTAARLPKDATREQRKRRLAARRAWFHNLDRDGNGQVSLDEYQAAVTPYFDRMDSNHDGYIDGAELKKAFAAERR